MVTTRRANKQTILDAVERGDLGTLRSVPALDVRARLDTEMGDTLLTWACRHNQAAVVQWLLGQGAELDGTTAKGATSLLVASQENIFDTLVIMIA